MPGSPEHCGQGATMSFGGDGGDTVLSISASQTCGTIDITGIDSPSHEQQIAKGDLEPLQITCVVLGAGSWRVGDEGELSFNMDGRGYGVSTAVCTDCSIDATAGEIVKSTWTFRGTN